MVADGDMDERREMWVDSIQIRAGKLTDDEIAALGGPTGTGIAVGPAPVPSMESTDLTATLSGDGTSVTISWHGLSHQGAVYTLESSPSLLPGSWELVPTTGTSITIPITEARAYFRLSY